MFWPLRGLRWPHEGLHGERNTPGFEIDAEHLHLDDLTRLDSVGRLLDEAVRKLADVNEAVLVDADVDEGSELGDVGDDALEHHVRLDVSELANGLGEAGCDELVARVAAGLAKFFEDVGDRERTRGELFRVDLAE